MNPFIKTFLLFYTLAFGINAYCDDLWALRKINGNSYRLNLAVIKADANANISALKQNDDATNIERMFWKIIALSAESLISQTDISEGKF